MNNSYPITSTRLDELATSKLIRNTYILLSMTLLFSGLTAVVSIFTSLHWFVYLGASLGALGLIWFVLPRTAHSTTGLGVVFAITGLLGFSLGPLLNHYLALPGGSNIVATAMGGTGIIFLALSGYTLISRKNFSFMGGFLAVGLVVMLCALLANIFLHMPVISLAISAGMILLMSGFILYDTSRMLHDSENTNYVLMTVSLYLNIFNIFVHLLNLLGIARDE